MYEGTILIKEMAQRSCHNYYLTGMLVRLTKYINARHAQLITIINTYLCIVLYICACQLIDIYYLRSCVLI